MSNKEIFVYSTGAITVLDSTVELSSVTSPLQDLDTDGVEVGLLASDSPVVITPEKTTNNLKAYQNDAIQRITVTDASVTMAFSMLEDTKITRELYYGSEETESDGVSKINFNPSASKKMKIAVDLISNDVDTEGTVRVRRLLAEGTVESIESVTVQNGEPEVKTITLRIFGDADTGTALTVLTADITPDEDEEEEE